MSSDGFQVPVRASLEASQKPDGPPCTRGCGGPVPTIPADLENIRPNGGGARGPID